MLFYFQKAEVSYGQSNRRDQCLARSQGAYRSNLQNGTNVLLEWSALRTLSVQGSIV